MSTLQVANIHLESTGNNRIQYDGSNTFTISAGDANVAVINSTSISISTGALIGGALSINGATTANTMTINGATTANSVTINGATSANSVTINGATTLSAEVVVGEYNITGTANTLDPSNGIIQRQTLSANVTYSDGLANGESIILMINDGGSNQVTWPTIKWVNNGNSAPSLPDGDTWSVVSIWKTAGNLYGAVIGND